MQEKIKTKNYIDENLKSELDSDSNDETEFYFDNDSNDETESDIYNDK